MERQPITYCNRFKQGYRSISAGDQSLIFKHLKPLHHGGAREIGQLRQIFLSGVNYWLRVFRIVGLTHISQTKQKSGKALAWISQHLGHR